ncbi:MAG: AAA family ATPase [Dolichospermum sp. DEX189]|jgi:predicted ATPase|nr:AAA family ATPase [Dolichospermum sp. DEX189]
MRIIRLEIKNFRAIKSLKLTNLGDVVVIAGPNGSGKSSIFDAIRLLKSGYGGYQDNEVQQWFNEFQINLNQRSEDILSLLQDRNQPLEITAEFLFNDKEKNHILNEWEKLENDQMWYNSSSERLPQQFISTTSTSLAYSLYQTNPKIQDSNLVQISSFKEELNQLSYIGHIKIWSNRKEEILPSQVLSLAFRLYQPQQIGIIDYHGANRVYSREPIGGINLNSDSTENQLRQSSLYNYQNKYSNLKTAIASSYLRQLIREKSGLSSNETDKITDTLKELFKTFFPGKKFLGPQPKSDGSISFDVKTPSGAIHDINELSSGEKEVLYGYLRLWNTAPKNSVLLIDEPELHLNPRLVSGLANFYHEHLGKPLGNQLWLVTHSDTLIREAVGVENFRVFHLQSSSESLCENQATEIKANEDIKRVIISLVGESAYLPEAKIVILEGGGDTEFDKRMVSLLFPQFSSKVNIISGGNKKRVADLYQILEKVSRDADISAKVYAINDSDINISNLQNKSDIIESNCYTWNVYHIENYLLEPHFIIKVIQEINFSTQDYTEDKIYAQLKKFASDSIRFEVEEKLRNYVNNLLIKQLDLSFDPKIQALGSEFSKVVQRCYERIGKVSTNELSKDKLIEIEERYRLEYLEALKNDSWLRIFPGRKILKLFVGEFGHGVQYEKFRNLILFRMRDANFQPEGMKNILSNIHNISQY